MPIDESRVFKPVRIAVLTVSNSRKRPEDRSGDLIVQRLTDAGHQLADRATVKDVADLIVQWLEGWIADPEVDCIISTSGTGLTGRDVTPEAFARVWEKEITGFGELFRWLSNQTVGPSTIQSAPAQASRSAPICSRCQAPPAARATGGTAFSLPSSTTAIGPATSRS